MTLATTLPVGSPQHLRESPAPQRSLTWRSVLPAACRPPASGDKGPYKPTIWRWEESDDAVRAYLAFFGILLAGCIPAVQASRTPPQRRRRQGSSAPRRLTIAAAPRRYAAHATSPAPTPAPGLPAVKLTAACLTDLGAAGEPVCRPAILPGACVDDHLHRCAPARPAPAAPSQASSPGHARHASGPAPSPCPQDFSLAVPCGRTCNPHSTAQVSVPASGVLTPRNRSLAPLPTLWAGVCSRLLAACACAALCRRPPRPQRPAAAADLFQGGGAGPCCCLG